MEPLRTPDYASESMRTALSLSARHKEELRAKDRAEASTIGAWHFRLAGWDPCFDVAVDTSLRSADFAMVAKTEALYEKKPVEKSDYRQAPQAFATNVFTSSKLTRSR